MESSRAEPSQRPVVAYVALLYAVTLGLTWLAADLGIEPPGQAAWWALPALGVLVAAGEFLYVGYRWGDHVEGVNLVEAAMAPLLFAFPTPTVVVTVALGQLVGSLLARNEALKTAFNIAMWSLAAVVGSAVMAALSDPTDGVSWWVVVEVVAALAAVTLVNQLLFACVIALASRMSAREALVSLRPRLSVGMVASTGCNLSFGLLYVLAYLATPASVLLFFVPLLALHVAYRGYVGAVSDGNRLAALHRAAGVLGVPVDPADAIGPFLREVAVGFEAQVALLVMREDDGLCVYTWDRERSALDVRPQPLGTPSLEGLLVATPTATRLRAGTDPTGVALAAAGRRDGLVAPVVDEGRLIGALAVLDQAGIENYARGELSVLEALAREAADTIAKGRMRAEVDLLVEAEAEARAVVEELQKALMPPRPDLAGAELGMRYVASDDTAPTGGDMYDWHVLPDGSLHLVVIDVLGHGLAATKDALTVMHTLRIAAMDGTPLGELVERADALLSLQYPDLVATCIVARYQPTTGELRIAGGGHPPALLVRREGVEQVAAPGGAIGWPGAGSEAVATAVLKPGDALVLYTDGLIEARKDILEGMESLLGHAAAVGHLPAADLADALVDRALEGAERRDDSLALVLRRVPVAVSETRASWRADPDVAQVSVLRRALAGWLADRGHPGDDAALVVSELLTNAVRVARTRVTLSASLTGSTLVLEVGDDGPGSVELAERAESARANMPGAAAESGRGLSLVRMLADDVNVLSTSEGSVVRCTLPAAIPAASAPAAPDERRPASPVDDTPGRRH
jgi:serine phosphatase RsbU (regulator of sigma subunit)/anti-sigma regulatory factor (Ser/Thr protein kinase)